MLSDTTVLLWATCMKKAKINITIDSALLESLKQEAERLNLPLSRLIENKLKGIIEVKKQ